MPAMTHFERKRFDVARDEDRGAFELPDYDSEIDHLRKTMVETIMSVGVREELTSVREELTKSMPYLINHGREQVKTLNSIRVILFLLLLAEFYRIFVGR